jgi:hypothetical protein
MKKNLSILHFHAKGVVRGDEPQSTQRDFTKAHKEFLPLLPSAFCFLPSAFCLLLSPSLTVLRSYALIHLRATRRIDN